MMMRYFLIPFFLMTTQAEAAKFRVFGETPTGVKISLRGVIEQGDEKKLEALVLPIWRRRKPDFGIVLFLHSDGGNLQAAMRLGRIERRYGLFTTLSKKTACYSACPLISMAGWDRFNKKPYRIKHPWAKLGVHHPYERLKNGRKGRSPKEIMGIVRQYIDFYQGGIRMYHMMVKTLYPESRMVKNRELKRMGDYRIQSHLIWPKAPPPRHFNTGPMMPDEKFAKGVIGQDTSWDQRPHTHAGQDRPHTHGEQKTYTNTVVISYDNKVVTK